MNKEINENLINNIINANSVFLAGPSCSGKSTLAEQIKTQITGLKKPCEIVKQDDYFKDLKDMPRNEQGYCDTETPDAFWIDEFVSDVATLQNTGKLSCPIYNIAQNRREGYKLLKNQGGVTVVEGLHAIELLRYMNGLKIYLKTDSETCLARKIERDTTLFGVSEDKVKFHYNNNILPSAVRNIYPQQHLADIIIENNKEIRRTANDITTSL